MLELSQEEVPSFNLKFSFQSNMAFLVALFILSCALGWAIRDHKSRQIELASEEQEDKLYLVVLGVLFFVCTLGAFSSFNRTKVDEKGRVISGNIVMEEFWQGVTQLAQKLDKRARSWPPYTPDLPVTIPIPKADKMDKYALRKDEPDNHYFYLAIFVFVTVCLLSVYYFWPRTRPDISPPPSYSSRKKSGSSRRPQTQST